MLSDIPFIRIEYNADHAQLDAENRMGGKGPQPKSGRHHALAARISELMLVNHYSPYAVLKRLDEEEAWPKGLMICEKTLYNWIEAGDIPYVTIENLPRKGSLKRKKGRGGHRRHSNVEFAARSIEKRPKTVAERKEAGHWEGDTVYSTTDRNSQMSRVWNNPVSPGSIAHPSTSPIPTARRNGERTRTTMGSSEDSCPKEQTSQRSRTKR